MNGAAAPTAPHQNSSYPQGSMLTYAPFGLEAGGCTQSTTDFKFASLERDAESGWDNANARTYAPNVGRFLSPDPDRTGTNPENPQSWNGYSYVLNTPLLATDSSGMLPRGNPVPPAGGPGISCTLEGFDVSCGYINQLLEAGSVEQCEFAPCGSGYVYDTSLNSGQWLLVADNGAGAVTDTPVGESRDQMEAAAATADFDLYAIINGLDPAESYSVSAWLRGFALAIQVLGSTLNDAAVAALPGAWKDPLTSFHNGDPSWYSSEFGMFNVSHFVDDPKGGQIHDDPFGPWNPLHFVGQVIPGWLLGTEKLPPATCTVIFGCSVGGGL